MDIRILRLREVDGVDAVLVSVYFVGDDTVRETEPVFREGWNDAIVLATEHLGLRASSPWLRKNLFDVFLDVADLRDVNPFHRGGPHLQGFGYFSVPHGPVDLVLVAEQQSLPS